MIPVNHVCKTPENAAKLICISPSMLPLPPKSRSHPSLSGASFTLKIVRCCSAWILSSLIMRASIRTSSPSTLTAGVGILASRTKWLSQWGQYSSLWTAVQFNGPIRMTVTLCTSLRIPSYPSESISCTSCTQRSVFLASIKPCCNGA